MEGQEAIDSVWKACAYGEFDKLKELVSTAENKESILHDPDENGYYCIQWAALNNRIAIVSYLIDNDVNLNAQDATGQTALHWSAVRGAIPAMETLLRAGADPSVKDSRGYTICHVAAQYGQTTVLYHLHMKWGTDVDAPDSDGRTPLHWAAYKGFPETIRLLLVMGADVMAEDVEKCTPLHWAAIKGNGEAAITLLQGGAVDALEALDSSGCTPSQLAIDKGHRALGINMAEYRQHKEMLHRGGMCGALAKLHLSPIIWGIILGMLSFMSLAVISNKSLMPQNPSIIAAGAWLTYTLAFVGLIFLYKTTTADPGFLPRNTSGGAPGINKRVSGKFSSSKIDLEDGEEEEENSLNSPALWAGYWNQLCVSCKIVRPLRAKHCAVTGRCVECFDHYCPWVGNAIGKGNRHYFLVFLWLELGAIMSSAATVITCLHSALNLSSNTTNFSVLGPIIFVIFDLLLLVSVAALAIAQASQVSRNVTTNELSNWVRYKYLHSENGDFENPFDQGCRNNCAEICFPHKARKPCYTLEQLKKKASNRAGERDSLMKSSLH